MSYISAGGNVFKILFLLFICVFTQMLGTAGDYWISYWYFELFVFIYQLQILILKYTKLF